MNENPFEFLKGKNIQVETTNIIYDGYVTKVELTGVWIQCLSKWSRTVTVTDIYDKQVWIPFLTSIIEIRS